MFNYKVLLGSVIGVMVLVFGAYVTLNGESLNPADSVECIQEREVYTERTVVENTQNEIADPVEKSEPEYESVVSDAETESEQDAVNSSEPESVQSRDKYTAADVALHATKESCWTSINGTVYDLTSFISKHPGGERAIMKICGTDGTALFMNTHGGDAKPEKALASLVLGELE